jgi:hypothetical protein
MKRVFVNQIKTFNFEHAGVFLNLNNIRIVNHKFKHDSLNLFR